MDKKAIIFDLDGTLLDTKEDLLYSMNLTRKNHGLKELKMNEFIAHLGRGLKVLFDEVNTDINDRDILNIMYDEFLYNYSINLTHFTKPYNEY